MFHSGIKGSDEVQNRTTYLLNKAAYLTSVGAFVMSIVSYFFVSSKVYFFYCISVSILYLVIPLLQHFGKQLWAQIYIVFGLPNWIYAIILLSGTFFSQGIASMVTIILGYFFFQKNKPLQILAIVYNSIMFLVSTTFAHYFPPIISIPEVPFDEVSVYIISFCWIYLIFFIYEMERESLIKSLQLKNQMLENTTAELERFTHIASHDLKSPLRTIISFLGLAERDLKNRRFEEMEHNLGFAASGARQLNYLIRDVLEFSKINASTREEAVLVDLNGVLAKAKFNLNADLQEKNATVISNNLPWCHCNETEFVLIFQNLIQNGIKYNKTANPTVRISSEEGNGELLIHFQDNGIGIEEQYFQKIFEHFKRLHTSNEYSGTGLGLSLCKKIVEKYKGRVSVKSTVGEGSTFTINLPTHVIEQHPKAELIPSPA